MADFKISGRMTVANLKKQFKDEFKVTLRFLDAADDKATLASLQPPKAKRIDDMKITGNTLIRSIETKFRRDYGINIEVAKPDDSQRINPAVTLRQAAVGKYEPEPKKQKTQTEKPEIVMSYELPEHIEGDTEVRFYFDTDDSVADKTITVDWGDGSPLETLEAGYHEEPRKTFDATVRATQITLTGYIQNLYISYNPFDNIDVSRNNFLKILVIEGDDNGGSTLQYLDLSANTELEALNCAYNNLQELDLSACVKLKSLNIAYNDELYEVDTLNTLASKGGEVYAGYFDEDDDDAMNYRSELNGIAEDMNWRLVEEI